MVIDVQKIRRVLYLTTLGAVTLALFVFNPLVMLLFAIGFMGLLAVTRQMNLYKILMIIKRYAKNVSRLQMELRTKLHTGAIDYYNSLENEELTHGSRALAR